MAFHFQLFAFAKYFILTTMMLITFMWIYTKITPYCEWKLIHEGKIAPALTFGGAILGFTIPLIAASHAAVGLGEFITWSVISAVVQLLAFWGCFKMFPGAAEENNVAAGTFYAFCSIAIGLINGFSMIP